MIKTGGVGNIHTPNDWIIFPAGRLSVTVLKKKKKLSNRKFLANINHRMSIRKGQAILKRVRVLSVCRAHRTNRDM